MSHFTSSPRKNKKPLREERGEKKDAPLQLQAVLNRLKTCLMICRRKTRMYN